ncbi:hypothetical protein JL720_5468 [Aureococcus anophagefferens]|nr:hypothetical protein JL720_5468 [Aureococcus anophagefferens]
MIATAPRPHAPPAPHTPRSCSMRILVCALVLSCDALVAPARRRRAPSRPLRSSSEASEAAPQPAPPSLVDRAKAFVVADFGRAAPATLREDFGFSSRGERLSKKRYLRNGDLAALRAACGGTLGVTASDYRVDGGDPRTVWFSVALSGAHEADYAPPAGVEGAPLAATGQKWATAPTAGCCSFDEAGQCYFASLGVPSDRDDDSRGAEGLFVAVWAALGGKLGLPRGRQLGLALGELLVRKTPATPRGAARREPPFGEATMVEIASAALQELLYLPPDGVLGDRVVGALFSDDCVVVGADFPALPLKKASKTKPWGEAYAREGVVLENYRVSSDDGRCVVVDARLPGSLEAASVHVDDDERVFRVSLGFVLRSAPNPLEALAESLAPLERAVEDAADLKEELDRSLEPVISAAGATLLELEANRAALDASVAEANAQYAAAKADLETTLAEYEAKYEELVAPSKNLAADVTRTVEDVNDQVAYQLDEANRLLDSTVQATVGATQAFVADPLAALRRRTRRRAHHRPPPPPPPPEPAKPAAKPPAAKPPAAKPAPAKKDAPAFSLPAFSLPKPPPSPPKKAAAPTPRPAPSPAPAPPKKEAFAFFSPRPSPSPAPKPAAPPKPAASSFFSPRPSPAPTPAPEKPAPPKQTFSLPSFKAPETKKAPPPPKAPSPPKAKQSFSFFGPTPAPAPKPTPAPAPKPASKGSGFSFFGGGEDAPPPSPSPAAKPAAPASKGFSLYTPPPSPSPAAKPAPASKGFSFFGGDASPAKPAAPAKPAPKPAAKPAAPAVPEALKKAAAEARARQQAKDDAAKAARKRNAPNRNG